MQVQDSSVLPKSGDSAKRNNMKRKRFIRFLASHGWSQNDIAHLFSISAPRVTQILSEPIAEVLLPCRICKKEIKKEFELTDIPGLHENFRICEICLEDLIRESLI